jgi:NADH-quinone oxidoreductase subunit I
MLGSGIIKGLRVTARNLLGSFHDPARLTTVEYPEVRTHVPEAYRSFPFLVYDGENPIEGLRCVACKICESECPTQCIYIEAERDERGRPKKKPRVFDIDTAVCMSCGLCAEVCPFDSIKMDQRYELSSASRFEALLAHRDALAKPNSYYHSIHPTEAAEVDHRLAEEKRIAAEKAAAKVAAAAAQSAATPSVEASKPSRPA